MADFRVVRSHSGDWVGVYRDGHLYHQGHSTPTHVWLELLGVQDTHEAIEEMPEGVVEEMGDLPGLYRDLEREATDQNAKVDLTKVRRT